jgi:exonuclease SbcD
VALGHLHGPQGFPLASAGSAKVPHVRYSGSPLAYSFSEESHLKSVTILEIGPTGPVGIETVETPVPRAMRTLTGNLDDLLSDPGLQEHADDWIRVLLTDAIRPERAMDRLRERFPFAISLTWQAHHDGVPVEQVERRVDPNAVSPVEVVTAFVEHVTGIVASGAVRDLADEAVQRVRIAEVHS